MKKISDTTKDLKYALVMGCLGGSVVEHLPLAQDMILESWDRVLHRAPCMEPGSPSACISLPLSLCVSHE